MPLRILVNSPSCYQLPHLTGQDLRSTILDCSSSSSLNHGVFTTVSLLKMLATVNFLSFLQLWHPSRHKTVKIEASLQVKFLLLFKDAGFPETANDYQFNTIHRLLPLCPRIKTNKPNNKENHWNQTQNLRLKAKTHLRWTRPYRCQIGGCCCCCFVWVRSTRWIKNNKFALLISF